jgi:hypothetical protein
MPIMYEPQYGMPVLVPDGRENDFLALGYRSTPPYTPPPPAPSPEGESTPTGEQTPPLEEETTGLVKINSASLKELTERCGLSTAQAKELRDGRPYATVEDLIAKIPDISWTQLSPQISYET